MIVLFTDFGAADPYLGQVKAVLAREAPSVAVIDLLNDASAYCVEAAAHLLAALAPRIPAPATFLAVVDPGVGSARNAVVLAASGRWYVGPDNGLLSVLAARAPDAQLWRIAWAPAALSASFHGRDLFAPIAAQLARGEFPRDKLDALARLDVQFGAADLAEIVYIDHYGNAMTGLRAQAIARDAPLLAGGLRIGPARVFSELAPGEACWYENSAGLAEIAVNRGSAAAVFGLEVGQRVQVGD